MEAWLGNIEASQIVVLHPKDLWDTLFALI